MKVNIPRKLLPLLEPKRWKVARGGRNGAKSWTFANVLLNMARRKCIRIVNAREIQKSIKGSVYTLYTDRIQDMGLSDQFRCTDTYIRCERTGSEFTFIGLQEQTVDSVKSLEGCDIFWMEEGQAVSNRSMETVIPTIRKTGSEIWCSYNPRLDSDPIHIHVNNLQKHQPHLISLMEVGMDDNPFASQEMFDARELDYLTDPVKAQQIWGGQTKQITEGAVYEQQISKCIADHRVSDTVVLDPAAVSVLAFDLGRNDATSVILGNYIGPERRITWAYEKNFEHFSHYIEQVKLLQVRIDVIILPHDAKAKTIAAVNSVEELCRAAWPSAEIIVLPPSGVEIGIDNVRANFHRLLVNPTGAARFWDTIKRYARRPTGLVNADGKMLYGEPIHDEASHMGDCLRYWMQYTPVQKDDQQRFLVNQTPSWNVTSLFG